MISKVIIVGFSLFAAVTATVKIYNPVVSDDNRDVMMIKGKADNGHAYSFQINKDCINMEGLCDSQEVCLHNALIQDETGKTMEGLALQEGSQDLDVLSKNEGRDLQKRWKIRIRVRRKHK